MTNKMKLIIYSTFIAFIVLTISTIAYFRRIVNGNIVGQTGNLVLIVNEADAIKKESFSVSLNRNTEEPFVMPDDKGVFDINIDSTGSSTDVEVTIIISRTNLPDNLKFYFDENYTQEFVRKKIIIEKSDEMKATLPVYWFWDGSVDDENDTLFIGETLEANVSVKATLYKSTLIGTLIDNSKVDTNVNFAQQASDTNGQGLLMMSETQTQDYPIIYFRGNVTNNNVIFADLCWLIVRTTETGGIKLVYNGPVVQDADGTQSCTNYSGVGGATASANYSDIYAGTTSFNTNSDSPVYVGYMYNDTNKYFASSVLDAAGYKLHLTDETIDSETGRHTQNLKDSNAKIVLDGWYEQNLLGKPEESLLEDSIWCNDRSVISETYSIENYANGTNTHFKFSPMSRLAENTSPKPSVTCTRDVDKFTVDVKKGNGDLTYPIGLLTSDEINMAGHPNDATSTSYLFLLSGSTQWTISPFRFWKGRATACRLSDGDFYDTYVNNSRGVRPAITLRHGVSIAYGNGDFLTPYKIEVN